jgi:gliding motility associated protien GldN
MKKIKIILFVMLKIATTNSFAQTGIINPPKYPTNIYVKSNTPNRKPIPYTTLREADVMWSKRVWRVIDLREKMNFPLYYPTSPLADRKSLFDVIKDAALQDGSITCFNNPAFDDEFRYEMTKSEIEALLTSWDTLQVVNVNTGISAPTPVKEEISSEKVWKYWVKEDWFYDKQRSVMDVRIIGLCPLIEKTDENGNSTGFDKALFWVYFPECRPIFAQQDVYMRHNDAERRTIDDIFWKRMFSSYIRKESNVYDRSIIEYKSGLDALLESERVKNDIFTFEHDLWHF